MKNKGIKFVAFLLVLNLVMALFQACQPAMTPVPTAVPVTPSASNSYQQPTSYAYTNDIVVDIGPCSFARYTDSKNGVVCYVYSGGNVPLMYCKDIGK